MFGVCMHVYVCISVYMHTCVCVCVHGICIDGVHYSGVLGGRHMYSCIRYWRK